MTGEGVWRSASCCIATAGSVSQDASRARHFARVRSLHPKSSVARARTLYEAPGGPALYGRRITMVSKRLSALSVLLAVWLVGFPLLANATAIAHGDLAFSNLAITPAAGSVTLDGPWLFEAFAQANNSLGQINDQFNSGSSPGAVSSSVAVTWASATGAASAPNDPPDLAAIGAASSNVNIPGCGTAAAFSTGRGT